MASEPEVDHSSNYLTLMKPGFQITGCHNWQTDC